MKQLTRHLKGIATVLVALLLVSTIWSGNYLVTNAEGDGAERMNVVFVMDDSGSMLNTDKSLLRYEAMELFLGLAASEGNYMGAVVFNDGIILQDDVVEMNSREAKSALMSDVRGSRISGDTDIGTALYTATEMLSGQGNDSLESAIILLSDGNTDLKNADARDASLSNKQQAIEDARNKGIKVYGICLNANGQASFSEIKEISDATGGTSVEVKSSEDLKNVFSMFYGIIFDTNTIPIPVPEPDENGNLNVEFEIPEIGVEEANIIINTLNTKVNFSLSKPDGISYTSQELGDMLIKAKTFQIVKIPCPEGGLWKLSISGVSREEVDINMVYNSNLKLDLTNQDGNSTVAMNQSVNFKTILHSNGEIISDASIYTKYPVMMDITDANGSVRTEQMNANGAEAVISCTFDKVGEFDVVAYVDMGGTYKKSNMEHVTVTNTPPTAEDFKVKKLKFIGGKPVAVDLMQHASDAEDAELSFAIEDMTIDADTTAVDGTTLTVDAVKSGSGEIHMVAIDSAGEKTPFTVKVKVINLLLIILIVLLAIAAAMAAIVIKKSRDKKMKRIPGDLEIMAFDGTGEQYTETVMGTRGIMNIGHEVMNLENIHTGINLRECTFQAGTRDDDCLFSCKKPFYMETGEMQKQITLFDQNYVTIYSDEERTRGLCLCYKKEFDGGFSGNSFSGDSFGGW